MFGRTSVELSAGRVALSEAGTCSAQALHTPKPER